MRNLIVAALMLLSVQAFGAEISAKYITSAFNTLFSGKTTDGLTEGTTNKYFSNTLARGAVSVGAAAGLSYDSGTGVFSCVSADTDTKGCLTSTDWDTFNGKMSNPMTLAGDLIYGGASGAATRLAGNTTTTKQFLSQTGDGTDSAAPVWSTVSSSDVGLGNVTNDAQVKKSDFTAAGQILLGTGNATYSPLSIGTDGYYLKSNGTTAAWAAIPAASTPYKAAITLIAGDITAQYVDMAIQCVASSLVLILDGASAIAEGKDYSVSVESGKTRITFINDLATGGATPLVAGDIFRAQCLQ